MSIIKPINIISNGNKDNFDFVQSIFEITLTLKNNNIVKFRELSYTKHCTLLTTTDLVKYDMIESFVLYVTIFKLIKDTYNIKGTFNSMEDTYIFKNDDVYIEFTKSNDNYTNCHCYLKTLDNSRVFITPPNY